MFDEKGNPLGGGPEQMSPQMNINPDELPDAECKECGGLVFVQAVRGKIVSPILIGEQAPAFVPMQTLICANCNTEYSLD